MNFENFLESFSGCSLGLHAEIAVKLIVSLVLGLIIGFERELTNKTAGLRTHILVCLGSTVFTILSLHAFNCIELENGVKMVNDPARVAAQILTGIGFIGAGAVLHYGMSVFGLTTAATLWVTASIGMAIGAGAFVVGGLATVLTFITLVVIRKFENMFIARTVSRGGRVKISVTCKKEDQPEIYRWFHEEFKNIREISTSGIPNREDRKILDFVIDIREDDPINIVYEKISVLENAESVSVKQILV